MTTLAALQGHEGGDDPGHHLGARDRGAGVPEAQIQFFADTDPLLDALEAGTIDAAVMTLSDYTLASKRRPKLEAGVPVGTPASAAWGLRQQDAKLKAELDAYVENMRSGPSWNRLVVLYFGERALSALGRSTK